MTKQKNNTNQSLKSMYELQAQLCGALANPVRLHILDLLSDQEMTYTDMLNILKIPKANLVQHLSVLKDAGIIQARKEGPYQLHSLAIPKIKDACGMVRSLLLDKIANEEKQNNELIKHLKQKARVK